MRRLRRLPLRLRLTLAFATGMAVVLTALAAFVYVRTGADLLAANDAGLRSRAEELAADVRLRGPVLPDAGGSLIERDEAFAQIADASGRVVESSQIVSASPLLAPDIVRSLAGPTLFDRRVPGIDNVTRVLAVPVEREGGRWMVIVGSSLQDRRDAMLQLAATLAISGPVALLLISFAGWLLAGAALRPVERMRREAAAISTSEPGRRLSAEGADDEVTRLGATLNSMLDRVQGSVERERRFVDDASHELRTPLSILKAELDLALSRARSVEDLEAAIRSAAAETDHLVRLAEDLLVLSRAHGGELPVHRVETSLAGLMGEARDRCAMRAEAVGVRVEVLAPELTALVDPVRIRQALDNLLANALGHTPRGGIVRMSAEPSDGRVRLVVEDTGPGFPEDLLGSAFEPFIQRSSATSDGAGGAGLGLAIVRAIAEGHGGTAVAENALGGGARVTIILPDGE